MIADRLAGKGPKLGESPSIFDPQANGKPSDPSKLH